MTEGISMWVFLEEQIPIKIKNTKSIKDGICQLFQYLKDSKLIPKDQQLIYERFYKELNNSGNSWNGFNDW